MHPHDDLNQLALDFLYGLLDGPDAVAARARLDSPEGRVAIHEAEQFRAVLAAAAKLQFPEARFTPPTSDVRRNGRHGSLRWVGWVVAATLLGAIAIPGSATYLQGRHLEQRVELARAEAQRSREQYAKQIDQWKTQVNTASTERQLAMSKYSEVANRYVADVEKAESDIRAKQFNVVVSGPAAITPGAPNYFRVETKNMAGQLAPATLITRVVDQNRRVVFEPPAIESRGTYTLKLPIDLPMTPDRELSLEIDATAKEGTKAELKQKLALAAPVYLSHLTTDKPLYQPGETVRFRALLLDRFKLEPPKEDLSLTLSVLDPSGAELVNLTGISPRPEPLRGLAMGEYILGESAAGGEYTVRLREATGRTPEQLRKFLVNKYQPARLEKKLEFTRKSYGPGDEVIAACNAARVSGPLANQPVTASAQVDGVAVPVEHATTTDAKGAVLVKFKLPAQIDRGAASINLTFTDGGAVESLVKPVPVVLKKLNVEFYPEGGDLLAGVLNRIYVQARTPLGKPAEMRGRIVDAKGEKIAEVTTLSDDVEPGINQGQALFEMTPVQGAKYRLVIDKPEGIVWEHFLPEAKPAGVVLNTGNGVTTDREPLNFEITNVGPSRTVVVGAYARGRLLDHSRLTLAPNQSQKVVLQPAQAFGGVTRVTVFEEKGDGPARQLVPLAERLVFRQPSKKVELNVAADKTAYAPGDKAAIKINAKDESGKPVPAVAMLGVVNQSVVVMADEKSFRSMPTHFLLAGEVEKAEDLEHIDVLLGSHAKATAALDLLLGVQGWRRFVEQGPDMPPAKDKAPERISVIAAPKMEVDSIQTATKVVADSKRPEFVKASAEVQVANAKLESTMTAPAEIVNTSAQFQQAAVATVRAVVESYEFVAIRREWLKKGLALFAVFGIAALSTALYPKRLGWLLRASAILVTVATAIGIAWFAVLSKESPNLSDELASLRPLPGREIYGSLGEFNDTNWRQAIHNHWKQLKSSEEALAFNIELMQAQLGAQFVEQLKRRELSDNFAAVNSIVAGRDDDAKKPPVFGGGVVAMAQMDRGDAAGQPLAPRAMARAGGVSPEAKDPGRYKETAAAATKSELSNIRKGAPPAPGERGPAGDVRTGKPSAAPQSPPAAYRAADQEAAKKIDAGLIVNKTLSELNVNRVVEAGRRGQDEGRKALRDDSVANNTPQFIEPNTSLSKVLVPMDLVRDHATFGFGLVLLPNHRQSHLHAAQPFLVREYAHVHKPAADAIREDFTETVFWHPALIMPGEGMSVQFDLSDSVNRYQILATAHTLDGRLGAVKSELTARKPMNVEPKLPVEITAGDLIDVPVTVSNETDRPRDVKMTLETPGLVPVGDSPLLNWTQPGNSRSRRLFGFRPAQNEGFARLRLSLAGEDAIEARLPIVPEGFPMQGQVADELRGSSKQTITLPQTWVAGSLKCEVVLFPTPLADLVRGLDGLMQEPGGCFEQTSTTNYPNTLIAEYLRETNQANPEVLARAKGMLDRGYSRLVSFEVPNGGKKQGYEWFGHAPAHEALTAYGLLQFRDMARVTDVDAAMIARTREYLLARRDGQGGFQRNKGALDSFGRANESVTNAYIVWAMTESSKEDDVTKELDRLQRDAATNKDPYYLSLVANALLNRDRTEAAIGILNRLTSIQLADGSLVGTTKSITGSQGGPLKIETTALTVLGWLKTNRPSQYGEATRKAVKWISQQRQGQGAFGPTQSTIMALKALVAFAKANKQPPEAGTMTLQLGDKMLAKADFAADQQDAIILDVANVERILKPGDNALTITTNGKNFYPFTLGWRYQTLQPPSAQGCAVKLTTQLDRSELAEAESTRLNVTLENVSKQGQGMVTAIVGLPAGMKLPDDFKQLRDLAKVVDGKPGAIGFWEMRGRELVLYWRDLAPDAKVELHLDVIANIPGKYRGPASRAYLYYDPEAKHWASPLSATISAK